MSRSTPVLLVLSLLLPVSKDLSDRLIALLPQIEDKHQRVATCLSLVRSLTRLGQLERAAFVANSVAECDPTASFSMDAEIATFARGSSESDLIGRLEERLLENWTGKSYQAPAVVAALVSRKEFEAANRLAREELRRHRNKSATVAMAVALIQAGETRRAVEIIEHSPNTKRQEIVSFTISRLLKAGHWKAALDLHQSMSNHEPTTTCRLVQRLIVEGQVRESVRLALDAAEKAPDPFSLATLSLTLGSRSESSVLLEMATSRLAADASADIHDWSQALTAMIEVRGAEAACTWLQGEAAKKEAAWRHDHAIDLLMPFAARGNLQSLDEVVEFTGIGRKEKDAAILGVLSRQPQLFATLGSRFTTPPAVALSELWSWAEEPSACELTDLSAQLRKLEDAAARLRTDDTPIRECELWIGGRILARCIEHSGVSETDAVLSHFRKREADLLVVVKRAGSLLSDASSVMELAENSLRSPYLIIHLVLAARHQSHF